MRALVVRHYKTKSNATQRILGWTESPPVKRWRKDTKFVSNILQKADITIDAIYTSELARARNTGMYYTENLNVRQFNSEQALNEVDFGDLSKKNKRWVVTQYPGYKSNAGFVFPNGESYLGMQSRSITCLHKLVAQHSKQTILFVVHSGVIRSWICHFLKLNYDNYLGLPISHRYIGVFDFEGAKCRSYSELGVQSDFIENGASPSGCD